MFEVTLPTDAAGGCGATQNIALTLGNDDRQVSADDMAGGMTQLAIESASTATWIPSLTTSLLDDILADVVRRTEATDDDAARTDLGLAALTATEGPTTMVRYEAITSEAKPDSGGA